MLPQTMKLAAFFAMFLVALTAAVELAASTSRSMDVMDHVIAGKDPSVHPIGIHADRRVSGAEVIQSIYHIADIAVPIEVRLDGSSFWFQPDLIVEQTDVSVIDTRRLFERETAIGTNGKLSAVIFTASEER